MFRRRTHSIDHPDTTKPPIVIASAALISQDSLRSTISSKQAWQEQVWDMYDNLPELGYGLGWRANATSRARLYPARKPEGADEPEPVEEDRFQAPLDELLASNRQIMSRIPIHIDTPGETYLVGYDHDGQRRWQACTRDEFDAGHGGRARIRLPETDQYIDIDLNNSAIIRIWRPHPRRANWPDSPCRRLRDTGKELIGLSSRVQAEVNSRLAGAGILKVPSEVTIPTPAKSEGANPIHDDPFTAALIEAMVTPLRNQDSAAAVVPIVVRGPAEILKAMEHLGFSVPLDAQILHLRDSALRRMAIGLDIPPEVLLGMAGVNHWCTTPDVEIMTEDGWKTYDQLTEGEQVLTLNHDTGQSEWQPLLAINTWEVTDHPMVHIKGRRHHSVTTAHHRWPILSGKPGERGRTWTTSGELAAAATADGPDHQRQEYLLLAAPHADVPTEAKYSDALVEAVAWYYTEGSTGQRPGRRAPTVKIHQSATVNPGNCARIERALTNLFGPPSDKLDKGGRYASKDTIQRHAQANRMRRENPEMTNREIARRLGVSATMVGKYLTTEPRTGDATPRWRITRSNDLNVYILNTAAAKVICEQAPGRVVRLDFIRSLTAAQLELFIDVSIRGDGYYMGGKTPIFGQKNPAMVDALELAAILSGRSVYRALHTAPGLSKDGPREKTQHMVTVANRTTFAPRGRSFTTVNHTGTIWCPTTPNGTWLARHNGTVFYTGNSSWKIEESAINLHIKPMLELICDALTVQFYRPALEAMGVADAEDYCIWYDTTDLVLRPNRAPESVQLYDRGLLSGESVRHEHGFSEGDSPSLDEYTRHLALELIKAVPALAPHLLPMVGLSVPQTVPGQIVRSPTPPEQDQDQEGREESIPQDTGQRTPQATAPSPGQASQAQLHWRLNCLEMATLRALDRSGKWLLGRNRANRRYANMPASSIHTVIPVQPDQLDAMLAGAFTELEAVAPGEPCLHDAVIGYVRGLLVSGQTHQRHRLEEAVVESGCLSKAA